jgi:FkbM family methyltransferase
MNRRIIKKLVDGLVPPLVERKLFGKRLRARETECFAGFYANFVRAGDLVFDIGANLGNRVRAFRRLGCKVVAVEPQRSCVAALRREFGGDSEVVIVPAAAGKLPGRAVLRTSPDHVLSSLSDEFIERTKASGRFAASEWTGSEEVDVVTLDGLVLEHGLPRLLKMDVEGYEPNVVAGLSQPVPVVSLEWTPELSENAVDTVRRLGDLGDYRFNLSWGESMRLSKPVWWTYDEVLAVIELMEGESLMFGDIYAKLQMG